MWEIYSQLRYKYPKISLDEERQLILQAQRRSKKKAEELVLRHLSFVIARIHKKVFPTYLNRFGDDILSEAIFILYEKIKTYDLNYKDKNGNPKPVRFSSYVWKRIDGFIIDFLKEERDKERRQEAPNWERWDEELTDLSF